MRQGQKGSSMFIIHRGAVDVRIKEENQSKTVRKLREGDFFGEISLLTGAPRSADVLAEGETEVLEISNFCLKPIFEENPQLVSGLSQIIEDKASVFDSIKKFLS